MNHPGLIDGKIKAMEREIKRLERKLSTDGYRWEKDADKARGAIRGLKWAIREMMKR